MHRVVNLQSTGYNKDTIANHKTAIQNMRDDYSSYINTSQVNDGFDEDDNPTLGVNMDFNDATQASAFHDELRQYIQNNSGDFSFARTRVHDCNHAADRNEPCKIGDVKKLV